MTDANHHNQSYRVGVWRRRRYVAVTLFLRLDFAKVMDQWRTMT